MCEQTGDTTGLLDLGNATQHLGFAQRARYRSLARQTHSEVHITAASTQLRSGRGQAISLVIETSRLESLRDSQENGFVTSQINVFPRRCLVSRFKIPSYFASLQCVHPSGNRWLLRIKASCPAAPAGSRRRRNGRTSTR